MKAIQTLRRIALLALLALAALCPASAASALPDRPRRRRRRCNIPPPKPNVSQRGGPIGRLSSSSSGNKRARAESLQA